MDPVIIIMLWFLGGLVLFLATLVVIGYCRERIYPSERLWVDDNAWYLANGWIETRAGHVYPSYETYKARDAYHSGQTDE